MFVEILITHLRQYLFPREFRIAPGRAADLTEESLAGIAAAIDAWKQPPPTPPDTPAGKADGLETAFVLGMCNDLFRIRRNAGIIVKAGAETKEIRSIRRAIEHLDDALLQRGVEYLDLTGKCWDPRDINFEPKGQPVPVTGLAQNRIAACECPLVRIKGKMVQRAQGIIEVPA